MKKEIRLLATIALLTLTLSSCSGTKTKKHYGPTPEPNNSLVDYKDWFKVSTISNEVFLINDNNMATCYLVLGSEKAMLIDTGMGIGDLAGQVAALTDLPVIVVNTHGHNDHVGGDYQFDEVWVPEADIPLYESVFSQPQRSASAKQLVRENLPNLEITDEEIDRLATKVPSTVNVINEGDTFDLGGKVIEVCMLPGHTAGSALLLDTKDNILFSGDALNEYLWMWLSESLPLKEYAANLRSVLPRINGMQLYNGHEQSLGRLKADTHAEKVIKHMDDIMSGKVTGQEGEQYGSKVINYDFDDWHLVLRPAEAAEFAAKSK